MNGDHIKILLNKIKMEATFSHHVADLLMMLNSRLDEIEKKIDEAKESQSKEPTLIARPDVEITQETRTHVDTNTAARWLNRKPQTLRQWACLENGPIRPMRLNGRLAWAVSDISKALNL
jgi:hypothetical protein